MSQLAVSVYKFKSPVSATYKVVSFLTQLILIQKAPISNLDWDTSCPVCLFYFVSIPPDKFCLSKGKGKGKILPRTGHEIPKGGRCTTLLFL
jgi:hypothetical protein